MRHSDDDDPDDIGGEMHYAPLLEREVPVDLLEVQFVQFDTKDRSRGASPIVEDATDEDGQLIVLLATDRAADLQAMICRTGRYRVIARLANGRIFASKDRLMRPQKGRRPPPRMDPDPHVARPSTSTEGNAAVEKLLQRQVDTLEKANTNLQTALDACNAALRDKAVEAAAASTQLAGLQSRVSELEDARDDLRESLQGAQNELQRLRTQLKDSDFSPLDAIGQLDGALEMIGKTVKRFTD